MNGTDPQSKRTTARPAEKSMEIGAIMDEYEAPLLRYVSQLVWPDSESSQDVVQETFLRLHRLIEHGKGHTIDKVNQWLFRVAHNLAMDVQRKRGRTQKVTNRLQHDPVLNPEIGAEDQDAETEFARREACEAAMAALETLPEQERQVVTLKVLDDLTLREIGEILNLKIGTVHYRLTRGLEKLSKQLDENRA